MQNQQPSQTSRYPDMTLATGKVAWLDAPEMTDIELSDFEAPVQNICRYNGNYKWPLVKHLALGVFLSNYHFPGGDRMIPAYFAAHDLHECIVGDMVSGLKAFCPGFTAIENAWERHVHASLGLHMERNPDSNKTKYLDLRCLVIEMTMLGHPAADHVAAKFGGPMKEEERHAFSAVNALDTETCWRVVAKVIQDVTNGKD